MINETKFKMKAIGRAIRSRREEMGLSIDKVAQAIHVDVYDLAEYEFGVKDIYPEELCNLCKILKTDYNYFTHELNDIHFC